MSHATQWSLAQSAFERILEQHPKDPYALLSLGNLYYAAKFENKEKDAKYTKLAQDFFWKALQIDPKNIFAANGLGIIEAEQGNIQLAKDIFIKVREATDSVPSLWVNLGHVYLLEKQYDSAIKMYQNCLQRFHYDNDASVRPRHRRVPHRSCSRLTHSWLCARVDSIRM